MRNIGHISFFFCWHRPARKVIFIVPTISGTAGSWFEPSPYGMVYIQRGAFQIGPSDDEL
jgi:hypothetical protein